MNWMFTVQQTKIPLYPFVIMASFIASVIFQALFLKRKHAEGTDILLFCLLSTVLAFTGSKALTMILALPEPVSFLEAGMTGYGGAAGVLAAAVFYEKLKPSHGIFLRAGVLSLPLLYGLSKIACFLAGCCYGLPYAGPGCVVYPGLRRGSFAPVQIMETAAFLLVFLLMDILDRRGKETVLASVMSCAAAKFLLDFLRYDHIIKTVTVNQWISLLFFASAFVLLVIKKTRKRERRTDAEKRCEE